MACLLNGFTFHLLYVTINCCRFSRDSNNMVILWNAVLASDESSSPIGLGVQVCLVLQFEKSLGFWSPGCSLVKRTQVCTGVRLISPPRNAVHCLQTLIRLWKLVLWIQSERGWVHSRGGEKESTVVHSTTWNYSSCTQGTTTNLQLPLTMYTPRDIVNAVNHLMGLQMKTKLAKALLPYKGKRPAKTSPEPSAPP